MKPINVEPKIQGNKRVWYDLHFSLYRLGIKHNAVVQYYLETFENFCWKILLKNFVQKFWFEKFCWKILLNFCWKFLLKKFVENIL